MRSFINWKTTLLGALIAIVKFVGDSIGLSPDFIVDIVTILTALLGMVAGDQAQQNTISKIEKL